MAYKGRPVIGITMDIDAETLSLRHWYLPAIEQSGGIPLLISPTTTLNYHDIIDGLLIPGGDDIDPSYYNEAERHPCKRTSKFRTELEFSLIREIMRLRKPVLGICYGMQAINIALGGTLYQDIRNELPTALNHKEPHTITIKKGGHLTEGNYKTNSTHHQAVRKIGQGLEAIAFAGDGVVEAMNMRNYPYMMLVQWHPERMMTEPLSQEIFNGFVEASYGK